MVIYDTVKNNSIFTEWKRSALGRLLRNVVVSLLLMISFILCLTCIESTEHSLMFVHLEIILTPILILLIGSLIKLLLIKSNSQVFLLLLITLSLGQTLMLILKNQFEDDVSNLIVSIPSFILILLTILNRTIAAHKTYQRGLGVQLCLNIAGILGMVLLIPILYMVIYAHELHNLNEMKYSILVIVCMLSLCISFARKIGEFCMDILLGHVETDYYHYLVPPRVLRQIHKCRYSELFFNLTSPLIKRTN